MQFQPYDELATRIFKAGGWQLDRLLEWGRSCSWSLFHEASYDGWTFPIDEPPHGPWCLSQSVVNTLVAMPGYLKNLRCCFNLVVLSWGVDFY